ncbi:hypothetical protein GMC70_06915 [Streptococcus salivarius]|jgi:hypothetical protein|uniref:hypothetical protein n=1 Tax=Streptococcus salivarius TaxID=1304 RepID=UPI0012BD6430|nr:hypothetical protein [Streptococcus salivarius]MTQ92337.1 hypothetical protein [Streptococcus salivarius]
MNLKEIFREQYLDDELEEFFLTTEFEDLSLKNDGRYEVEFEELTRVVRNSFYKSVSEWTGNKCYNQGYFFLPSHVQEAIDDFCYEFFDNNENGIIDINEIDKLIENFHNSESLPMDDCSTSFFLVKGGVYENEAKSIISGLNEKVTKNTEPIDVLVGSIDRGFGLFHRSKGYTKPEPKFKHVSFWKKKALLLEDFNDISNRFKLLKEE